MNAKSNLRNLRIAVASAFIGAGRKHVFLPVYSAYYDCGFDTQRPDRADESQISASVREGVSRGLRCFALLSDPSEERFRVLAARVGKVFAHPVRRTSLDFDFDAYVTEVWEGRRRRAAVIIQEAWNRSLSDPSLRLCQQRLTREWESMSEDQS